MPREARPLGPDDPIDPAELEVLTKQWMEPIPGVRGALKRKDAEVAAKKQIAEARAENVRRFELCLKLMGCDEPPEESDPDIVLWWVLWERMDRASAFHRAGGPASELANRGMARALRYQADLDDAAPVLNRATRPGVPYWMRNVATGHEKTADRLRSEREAREQLDQDNSDRLAVAVREAKIAKARALAAILSELPADERAKLLGGN